MNLQHIICLFTAVKFRGFVVGFNSNVMKYFVYLQRLSALDDGWHELLQMWDSRQQGLSQSLNLQVRATFLNRDFGYL